jgi:anti-sigma factor RsiW
MDHASASELLGVYALDALDADEAAQVRAHLDQCPRCRDEVYHHQEAAAALAFAGATAPEGLWARISDQLDIGSPPVDMARMYPLQPATGVTRSGRRRRRPAGLGLASAVAAVAAVLVAFFGMQVRSERHDLHQVQQALASRASDQAATAALLEPGSTRVTLVSADRRLQVQAVVTTAGTGYLLNNNLPSLGSDRTYQLWGKAGATTVSLGVIGPHFTTVPFRADMPLSELVLTNEQAPGVVSSTQNAVAAGSIPA